MAFETVVFTDVTRSTSVDGMAGFNFQAISEGIDAQDRETIRELMLHQVSNRWPSSMGDTNHPPTSAYIRDEGRYYFSRGESTGQTHSGRRGNQLTQAAVTSDINDILPNRPAQLHGAVDWTLEEVADSVAPQWFAPLELTPGFESYELLEWAAEDPWVQQVLPAYLTMLQEATSPQPGKVVLIHDDIDTIMRWIALGTLLLDQEAAFRLEYRAFVAEPFRTRAHLVGVHPSLQEAQISGAHTIDLLQQTVSPIEISETAKLITKWVIAYEIYEALDVIGLAQRWIPIMGVELGAKGAEMIAGTWTAAIGREEWNLAIGIIERLAEGGYKDDLDLYIDELADAVSAYQLTGEDDFRRSARASRFAAKTGRVDLVQAIIPPTLESLAAEPESATVWVQELNPDGQWTWPDSLEQAHLTHAITDIARNAPSEALPGLLTIAKPIEDQLVPQQFAAVFSSVADTVYDRPELLHEVGSWFGTDHIQSVLRKQLLADLESPQYFDNTMAALASGLWDELCEPDDGKLYADAVLLLPAINVAKLRSQPIEARADRLRNTQKQNLPAKEDWQYLLQDAQLPEHTELYCVWIQVVGVESQLVAYLEEQLDAICAQDPTTTKAAEVERWFPLAQCLDDYVPRIQQLPGQTRTDHLHRFHQQIPTTSERLKHQANRIAGLFGRGKN